jgi:hypothetical protein
LTRFTKKPPVDSSVNADKKNATASRMPEKSGYGNSNIDNNTIAFKQAFTKENIISGIIFSEILQKPKSLRRTRGIYK